MRRSVAFACAFLLISSLASAAENTPKSGIHVFVALLNLLTDGSACEFSDTIKCRTSAYH